MTPINLRPLLGAVPFTLIVISCGGGDSGGNNSPSSAVSTKKAAPITRSITLSGAQATPPVQTTATGNAVVVVDPASGEITGGVTISGVSAIIGAHIHLAAPGMPGGVVVGLQLSPDGRAGNIPNGTRLSQDQLKAFQAGGLYVDAHTRSHPNGEIRGQITDDPLALSQR